MKPSALKPAMRCAAFGLLAAWFAAVLSGCRTPPLAPASASAVDETILVCTGPKDPPPRDYIGHIVATNAVDRSSTIRVRVSGCVKTPGEITVPRGTTVLGAVKRAGGFVLASSNYVWIERGQKASMYVLVHEPLVPELPGHYRVWYAGYECGPATGWRGIIDKQSQSDVPLEDSDWVVVPSGL